MGHRSNLKNSNKEEKHFNDLSYHTLFVVPQKMQKRDVPCDAVTQNTFFSVPVCKGESRLPKYDYSGYESF